MAGVREPYPEVVPGQLPNDGIEAEVDRLATEEPQMTVKDARYKRGYHFRQLTGLLKETERQLRVQRNVLHEDQRSRYLEMLAAEWGQAAVYTRWLELKNPTYTEAESDRQQLDKYRQDVVDKLMPSLLPQQQIQLQQPPQQTPPRPPPPATTSEIFPPLGQPAIPAPPSGLPPSLQPLIDLPRRSVTFHVGTTSPTTASATTAPTATAPLTARSRSLAEGGNLAEAENLAVEEAGVAQGQIENPDEIHVVGEETIRVENLGEDLEADTPQREAPQRLAGRRSMLPLSPIVVIEDPEATSTPTGGGSTGGPAITSAVSLAQLTPAEREEFLRGDGEPNPNTPMPWSPTSTPAQQQLVAIEPPQLPIVPQTQGNQNPVVPPSAEPRPPPLRSMANRSVSTTAANSRRASQPPPLHNFGPQPPRTQYVPFPPPSQTSYSGSTGSAPLMSTSAAAYQQPQYAYPYAAQQPGFAQPQFQTVPYPQQLQPQRPQQGGFSFGQPQQQPLQGGYAYGPPTAAPPPPHGGFNFAQQGGFSYGHTFGVPQQQPPPQPQQPQQPPQQLPSYHVNYSYGGGNQPQHSSHQRTERGGSGRRTRSERQHQPPSGRSSSSSPPPSVTITPPPSNPEAVPTTSDLLRMLATGMRDQQHVIAQAVLGKNANQGVSKWDGSPEEYMDFMTRFRSVVINNPTFADDTSQLEQLKMCLKGQALAAVELIDDSMAGNFEAAMRQLQESFGRRKVLERRLMHEMTNLKFRLQNNTNHSLFAQESRRFFYTINKKLRLLSFLRAQNLDGAQVSEFLPCAFDEYTTPLPKDYSRMHEFTFLLCPIIENALPKTIMTAWEKYESKMSRVRPDFRTLSNLMDWLDNYLKTEENMQYSYSKKQQHHQSQGEKRSGGGTASALVSQAKKVARVNPSSTSRSHGQNQSQGQGQSQGQKSANQNPSYAKVVKGVSVPVNQSRANDGKGAKSKGKNVSKFDSRKSDQKGSTSDRKKSCAFCHYVRKNDEGKHHLAKCAFFDRETLSSKLNFMKRNNLCLSCHEKHPASEKCKTYKYTCFFPGCQEMENHHTRFHPL